MGRLGAFEHLWVPRDGWETSYQHWARPRTLRPVLRGALVTFGGPLEAIEGIERLSADLGLHVEIATSGASTWIIPVPGLSSPRSTLGLPLIARCRRWSREALQTSPEHPATLAYVNYVSAASPSVARMFPNRPGAPRGVQTLPIARKAFRTGFCTILTFSEAEVGESALEWH